MAGPSANRAGRVVGDDVVELTNHLDSKTASALNQALVRDVGGRVSRAPVAVVDQDAIALACRISIGSVGNKGAADDPSRFPVDDRAAARGNALGIVLSAITDRYRQNGARVADRGIGPGPDRVGRIGPDQSAELVLDGWIMRRGPTTRRMKGFRHRCPVRCPQPRREATPSSLRFSS